MGDSVVWAELSQKEFTLQDLFDTPGFVDFVRFQSYDARGAWAKQYLLAYISELCMLCMNVVGLC